ncbi:hypothetical protein pdam_00023834 [Pocillopora damicornis]|uniref:Uncharacterized protein n=1 Tax=Pocillopora damicornis TaxID=46731 RepID=A0A3M6V351_POCDA|nr:hypothetical protein pdam_00023834 [Pocillopora damicornis]
MKEFYDKAIERPKVGLSDHSSVEIQPKLRAKPSQSKETIISRDLRPKRKACPLITESSVEHHQFKMIVPHLLVSVIILVIEIITSNLADEVETLGKNAGVGSHTWQIQEKI